MYVCLWWSGGSLWYLVLVFCHLGCRDRTHMSKLSRERLCPWATSETVCAFICHFGPGSLVWHSGTHCASVCAHNPVCKFHEIPKAEDIVSALRGKRRLPVVKNYVHMHLFKINQASGVPFLLGPPSILCVRPPGSPQTIFGTWHLGVDTSWSGKMVGWAAPTLPALRRHRNPKQNRLYENAKLKSESKRKGSTRGISKCSDSHL